MHDVNGDETHPSLIGKVVKPLKYFQDLLTDNDNAKQQLARLAVRALVSPVTSVAAERGGSILRKLGDPGRRNMGDTAVTNNMFFQNNRVYVDRLGTVAEHRCRNTAPKNNTASTSATDIDKRDDITREQLRREKGQIARKKQQALQKGPKTIKQVSGQISLTDFLNKNRDDADNGNKVEDKDNNDEEKDDLDDDDDHDDDLDDDDDDDHDDDDDEDDDDETSIFTHLDVLTK